MLLLFAALCCDDAGRADDVPWLRDVQESAGDTPQPRRPLTLLLAAEELNAPDRLARWKKRRAELDAAWRKFLGPMPVRPQNTRFEIVRTDGLPGVARRLIRYENEPGQTVEAYLLQPTTDSGKKRAGLVALHPTTDDTIHEIAGVVGAAEKHLGLKLAQAGFVVLCPKNFLWIDGNDYPAAAKKFLEAHPGTLGMHKMLYDAQRAVDILAALPDVDPQRLGTVGHSLGAKEVLYLMAFDERVRAGVFSEGGVAFDSTNWHAAWYLGPAIQQDDFPRNHHELLAFIAPRPFLILGGESGPGAADGERSRPYVAAAKPIYELYGQPVRLGLLNHRQGHKIPPDVHDRLVEWLTVYVKR